MDFPGLLGVALYRLRLLIRRAPVGALGPFFGFIAADMALDISRGRFGSAAIEVVIAPVLALVIAQVEVS